MSNDSAITSAKDTILGWMLILFVVCGFMNMLQGCSSGSTSPSNSSKDTSSEIQQAWDEAEYDPFGR